MVRYSFIYIILVNDKVADYRVCFKTRWIEEDAKSTAEHNSIANFVVNYLRLFVTDGTVCQVHAHCKAD